MRLEIKIPANIVCRDFLYPGSN